MRIRKHFGPLGIRVDPSYTVVTVWLRSPRSPSRKHVEGALFQSASVGGMGFEAEPGSRKP